MRDKSQAMTEADLLDLLQRVGQSWRWVHVERLPEFDGVAAFTKAQGED
jgi:isocitrate dehydrogenase